MLLGVADPAAVHPEAAGAGGEDAGGLVGAGQLGVPGAAEPGGVLLGAGGEGGGAAGGSLLGPLGGDPGGVTVGLERGQDLLAVDPPGGLRLDAAPAGGAGAAAGGAAQLLAPRVAQLVQHVGEPARVGGLGRWGVAGCGAGRRVSLPRLGPRSARSRLNAVDPLLAGVVEVGGDEVGGVGLRGRGSSPRRPRPRWWCRSARGALRWWCRLGRRSRWSRSRARRARARSRRAARGRRARRR